MRETTVTADFIQPFQHLNGSLQQVLGHYSFCSFLWTALFHTCLFSLAIKPPVVSLHKQ